MAQLTNHIIKEFIMRLDKSYFTSASFLVDLPDEGSYIIIKFIDNSNYYYDLYKNSWDEEKPYKINFSPGPVTKTAEVVTKNISDCLNYVAAWTENIKKELKASNPLYTEFEEFKKMLNEKLSSSIDDDKKYFTEEEIKNIKTTIDELSKKVEELHKKNEITAQELKQVKDTLKDLKEDSNTFPKKTWLRTAGSKLIKITGMFLNSKAGQVLIEKGTKKILQLPE